MLNRIKANWSVQRGLYLIMGLFIIIQFSMDGEWPGIVLGVYFFAMGLLNFGCAAGNCSVPQNNLKNNTN